MRKSLLVLLAASTFSQPLFAQDAIDPVREAYAARGVDSAEAARRTGLAAEAARLQAKLMAEQPTRFAGLYIDDGAQFRVVVQMVGDAQGLLSRYTTDPAFVAQKADKPLRAQLNKKAAFERAMAARNIEYSSDYDVTTGRFRVGAVRAAEARAALSASGQTTDDVDLVQVDQLDPLTATLLGASKIDGQQYCDTSGACQTEIATTSFSVTNGTTKGMLTAGHVGECAGFPTSCVLNSPMKDQTGVSLTFVAQKNAGGEDYEWLTASNASNVFSNVIRYSTTTMPVTQVQDPTTYAVGTTVCKQGRTTGYTCGPIQSTNYATTYNGVSGTYVRVSNSTGAAMCDFGDSGGALFVMNTALGITHAKTTAYPNQCTFMPIQRISSLGLTVLTQ